jgi:alpha-amylase
MKKMILTGIAILSIFPVFAKKVQFNVNMTGQVLDGTGVRILSDFQSMLGWGIDFTPSDSTLMTQDAVDTNLFHFTVDLPAFSKFEFNYVNGTAYDVEIIPNVARVDSNLATLNEHRWIYVDSIDADTLKLAPVVFAENAPLGLYAFRFSVDMTDKVISPKGIHVAGSFQSNNPATHGMYSFGNNKYEIISYMPLGNYTYKFYNGNTLADAEIVPSACATGGERTYNLTKDIFVSPICFSKCVPCDPANVNTIEANDAIKVYPNPMSEIATIQFNDNELYHNLTIFDMTGKVVRQIQRSTDNSINISKSNFSSGVFTLMVENESGKRYSQKLIIQ